MPGRVVPPPDYAADVAARLHATIAEFNAHADAPTAEIVQLARTIKAQTDYMVRLTRAIAWLTNVMVVLVVAQLAIAVLA
jgi:hypothetical protein